MDWVPQKAHPLASVDTWHRSRDTSGTQRGEEVQQGSMSIPEQREILLSKARDATFQMLLVVVHPRTRLPLAMGPAASKTCQVKNDNAEIVATEKSNSAGRIHLVR